MNATTFYIFHITSLITSNKCLLIMSVSCNNYFILALGLFSLSYGLIIFIIESYARD